jgi:RNA polymerase sigma-70 factor (ECF subfamily)
MPIAGIEKSDVRMQLMTAQKYANYWQATKEDREDLVQDVMLKLWSSKSVPAHMSKAWLWAVVKNAMADRYRRNAICRQTEELDVTGGMFEDGAVNIGYFQQISDPFLMKAIESAFSCLSKEQLEPFLMVFNGMPYQEVANRLNIPLNTVRTRIYYAKQILQRALSKHR